MWWRAYPYPGRGGGGYPYNVQRDTPILAVEVLLGAVQGYPTPVGRDLGPAAEVSLGWTWDQRLGYLQKGPGTRSWVPPVDGQTPVKTLPSRILRNAGGNNFVNYLLVSCLVTLLFILCHFQDIMYEVYKI